MEPQTAFGQEGFRTGREGESNHPLSHESAIDPQQTAAAPVSVRRSGRPDRYELDTRQHRVQGRHQRAGLRSHVLHRSPQGLRGQRCGVVRQRM